VSGVSAYGTKLAISVTEDFWLIVTPRRVKMSQNFATPPARVRIEKLACDIRRPTRKHHSAEDKIRIVLEGLHGEETIAALCRREAIAESLYYSWSKEFLGEALARHGFKRHAERYPHIDSRGRAMLANISPRERVRRKKP
jgi:transposase-like protein